MIKLFFKLIKWVNPKYHTPFDCEGHFCEGCPNGRLRKVEVYCQECYDSYPDAIKTYTQSMDNNHKLANGYKWRFNAPPMLKDVEGDGNSYCDELVIGDWFHLEHMNDNHWWMRIGNDLNINITINDDGTRNIAIMDYGSKDVVAEMLDDDIKETVARKMMNR